MNCILTKSRYWYLPGNLHKYELGSEWQQPKGQGKSGSSQRGSSQRGRAKGASDQRGMAKGAQPKGLPLALKLEAI